MSILGVVLTLIVIGFLLWVVNTYIPMQAGIKRILNIVVVFVVILWLLYAFGIINGSHSITLPRVQ